MKTSTHSTEIREQILHVHSQDGFTLAGCLFEPPVPADTTTVIWIHGVSLGFSEREYVEIGRAVASGGLRFLSVETRGHNFGAWLRGPGGSKLAGSAWEYLSEAPMDVSAWRKYALDRWAGRIILAGHGWGAAKIVVDIAERGSNGLAGVVFASSGSLVRDQLDPSNVGEAETLVAAGRGWQLLPWGTRPGMAPNTVSAQSYAKRPRVHRDLYGGSGQPPALASVDVPILAWFGDSEGRSDGEIEGFFDRIRRDALAAPQVHTKMLVGGSFLYTGTELQVARHLITWDRMLNKSRRKKEGSL